MEFKHFSHNHGLVSYQMPEGTRIQCSGCKSPGIGNAYVCWECNYFLHEQCFSAPRFLTHPSHSLHHLTLAALPTYSSGSFVCKHCSLEGKGFSYSCSKCEFDLHVHCAHEIFPKNTNPQPQETTYPSHFQNDSDRDQPTKTMSYPSHFQNDDAFPNQKQKHYASGTQTYTSNQNNRQQKPPTTTKHFSHPHPMKAMEIKQNNGELCSACVCDLSGPAYCCTEPNCGFNIHKTCFESPREIRHKSHHQHPLTLHAVPPHSQGFNCDACQKYGNAFVYNCATCSYDLHINCANLPTTATRPDHKHNLTLYYSTPLKGDMVFVCDVCRNTVHKKAWVYCCRGCDFGTHLECVASEVKKLSAKEEYATREEELLKMQRENMLSNFRVQMTDASAINNLMNGMRFNEVDDEERYIRVHERFRYI